MTVASLLVFIVVLICLFYLTSLIPDARGQTIARVAVVVFALLWFLQALGLLGPVLSTHVR